MEVVAEVKEELVAQTALDLFNYMGMTGTYVLVLNSVKK